MYHGTQIGAWNNTCFADITNRPIEDAVAASEVRSRTAHYVEHHLSRAPGHARATRHTYDVFKPADNVTLGELQRRPRAWSWFARDLHRG